MDSQSLAVARAVTFVSRQAANYDASHDVEHCMRVSRLAQNIACEEMHPNPNLVAIAAILHDVVDHKFVPKEEESIILKEVKHMLHEVKLTEDEISQVGAFIFAQI